ncbi:hypothetical protein PROFUN_04263 [Planoprotostelium fungivorum]|uniref:Cytochrome b5 heme-binding domain-containing protein n=1 Tax=Planoprotostelium fungivorum TaxID=1890364 RepID=A0A2P6NV04_9EUKA|nr:hypothetical protein PROFUN_04263 [Planoprotostelium fungivorum]
MTSVFEYAILGSATAFLIYSIYQRFFHTEPLPPPPPPTAEHRDYTLFELSQYTGADPTKPILMSGNIYDVTPKASMYGPGGPYHNFTGTDASRALGKGVTDRSEANNTNWTDLTSDEMQQLDEWAGFYSARYQKIGNLIE